MKKPLVYIIILNWNCYKDTIECLNSINNVNYPNLQIVVVDNGSSDQSEIEIRKYFLNIKIIETNKNLGYAGGNNIGIRHALENKADYIMILNSDTIVTKEFLHPLIHYLEDHSDVGMVGPKIYQGFFRKRNKFWGIGSNINWNSGDVTMIGQGEDDIGQYNEYLNFERLTGACFLIRRNVFNKIGIFPEEYFLYYEETEFCIRAKNQGIKMVYVPDSIIYHKGSYIVGHNSLKTEYYFTRNILIFIFKNAPKLSNKIIFTLHFIYTTIKKILSLFIKKDQKRIKVIIKAIVDYINKNYGIGEIND